MEDSPLDRKRQTHSPAEPVLDNTPVLCTPRLSSMSEDEPMMSEHDVPRMLPLFARRCACARDTWLFFPGT